MPSQEVFVGPNTYSQGIWKTRVKNTYRNCRSCIYNILQASQWNIGYTCILYYKTPGNSAGALFAMVKWPFERLSDLPTTKIKRSLWITWQCPFPGLIWYHIILRTIIALHFEVSLSLLYPVHQLFTYNGQISANCANIKHYSLGIQSPSENGNGT